MEIALAEHMVILSYTDRPGIVGVVGQILGSLQDESSGFGVGEDGGCHVGLILLPDREWTPTRVGAAVKLPIG